MMDSSKNLRNKLEKMRKVFDLKKVIGLRTDKNYIRKYYKANQLAYSLFHTFSDRMYMGVSRNGQYHNDDLLEAARFVEKYISKLHAKNVLELATGRGATSAYLANRHKNIQFNGIDISEGQLDFAFKKAKKLSNYHPKRGDYHDLSFYKNEQLDIVYEIEAVCYSLEKETVLKEVYRVLKKGGVFILFDGYLNKQRRSLTKEELLAARLTEKSMAVTAFENYQDFIKKARMASFSIDYEEDVSMYILPTLRRFERLSKIFFNFPWLARIMKNILSKEFTYNAIAGYLMPDLITKEIACYYITILKK